MLKTSLETVGEDVIGAPQARPVLVDFWADGYSPCTVVARVLEQS